MVGDSIRCLRIPLCTCAVEPCTLRASSRPIRKLYIRAGSTHLTAQCCPHLGLACFAFCCALALTHCMCHSRKSSILHLLTPQDMPAPLAGDLVTQLSNILTYPLVALRTTLALSALVNTPLHCLQVVPSLLQASQLGLQLASVIFRAHESHHRQVYLKLYKLQCFALSCNPMRPG